jgi:Vitamin K-dependent gamma-carboxylase
MIAIGLMLTLAATLRRRQLWQFVRTFWTAPGSPYNLAVFRIVLFATIFFCVNRPAAIWFSQMPAQLRFPLFGLREVVPHIPITPQLVGLAASLLLLSAFLASIGLLTRFSAAVTTILALYVFGLPHLYGKVNHLHHQLIWFAALMAVSPCADVLSADAIIAHWRRGSRNDNALPARATKYALPLRFVWLLLGVIYFFPGFWKLWHVGLSWASPENIRFQMFAKWSEFSGWVPRFRLDRQPALCVLLGIGTLLFELSFLPLVFFRRCRPWLALAGLIFHNFTGLIMRIWFVPLQAMYVALIDWDWLYCPLHKRATRETRDRSSDEAPRLAGATPTRCRWELLLVSGVGCVLLFTNIAFGLERISEAWPFACYPLFDSRASGVRQVLTLGLETENGTSIELDRTTLSRYFPPDRERGLEEALLRVKDPARRRARLKAFWQLWLQNHPELRTVRLVRFFHDTMSTIPGQLHRAPLRRELLETIGND